MKMKKFTLHKKVLLVYQGTLEKFWAASHLKDSRLTTQPLNSSLSVNLFLLWWLYLFDLQVEEIEFEPVLTQLDLTGCSSC